MSAELTPRQFAVKAIHEDTLNVKNPSILAKLLKAYAQSLLSKKLKEQREICADNAKVKMKRYSTPIGGGTKPIVDRDSIINAPEPT